MLRPIIPNQQEQLDNSLEKYNAIKKIKYSTLHLLIVIQSTVLTDLYYVHIFISILKYEASTLTHMIRNIFRFKPDLTTIPKIFKE